MFLHKTEDSNGEDFGSGIHAKSVEEFTKEKQQIWMGKNTILTLEM